MLGCSKCMMKREKEDKTRRNEKMSFKFCWGRFTIRVVPPFKGMVFGPRADPKISERGGGG